MKGPQEQYTDDLKRKFGYYATWHPGVPLLIGDIGVVKDNVFTRIASLEDYEIKFEVREDDTPEDMEYSSQGSVSVTTKLSGTVSPQGSTLTQVDAGLIVEFSKESSILFKANQTRTNLIKNTTAVGDQILDLYRNGKWNKHWVVITELVKAESATVLISNNSQGKIELKANANINSTRLDIADAKFEFGALFSRGLETKIIGQSGLTPLFKLKGIKTRIFLPPIFKERGIKAFDLLTAETAKNEHKEDIYFGYISEDETE